MEHEYDYSSHEEQIIHNVEIEKEIKTAYIDYAMSVIIGRALPDVRDGLKPVHRRILYAMYEDGLTYDKPFRKSATTVGNVLGRYHPHGDSAVYDTMVRLAQPFSLRYMLIDGHGNFGNIDGDSAAAYRYTEARMSKIANEMLVDIDKEVVDFGMNFDNTRKEPGVLPSRFPNLLVNGSIGIAVGMATNIPPHNLGEVVDATIYMMDNPDCTVPDLMKFIKGPDFPTYGTIHGTSGIYEAYMTGRGRIQVRAKAHFEEKHGRTSIIITELPYQVNRSQLLESMVELVKTKRIEGISDIRNESGRNGMRIVIEVKKEANTQIVLNLLYKYTQLQDTFAVNMVALVDNEPRLLGLKELIYHYIRHQEDVIRRRTEFELKKAEREAHIYEGLKIAIDNIDEVISVIRSSASVSDARVRLQERFSLSEIQSQAIVEMPLGRLSGLERKKIEERLEALYALIDELKGILADESKITAIIKEDLLRIKEKYGDERRTSIEEVENEILIEDLIDRVSCAVTITNEGYIKRLPSDTYQAQRRGGKGITAMATKEEDFVKDVIVANSHDFLLMFSNHGRLYIKKCYEIPEAGRTSKGTNLVNVLSLADGEEITAVIPVTDFAPDRYLVMITRQGVVKRVNLAAFRTRRAGGLYAVTLDEGDELLFVMMTEGTQEIIAATAHGQAIRFSEGDVRCVGRQARGVRAIRLVGDDFVVGAAAVENDGKKLLTVTAGGYGKLTDPGAFSLQHRGGKGITCHKINAKTGALAGIAAVSAEDDIMLITDSGIIIRTKVSDIPEYGRSASGVIIMRLSEGASIVSFAVVNPEDEEREQAAAEDGTETPEAENSGQEGV